MQKFLTFVLAGLLLVLPAAGHAERADVAAALAQSDRSDQDREQDERRQAATLLNFLELEAGDQVFDFVAAGGYFSELIARSVGSEGFVWAHNPPRFIDRFNMRAGIDARGYGERLPNVVSLEREVDEINFVPNSIDLAFFNLVFHDLWFVADEAEGPVSRNPQAFVVRLFEGMRPGGVVGIVDHVAAEGADPAVETNRSHRVDPGVITSMMTDAGFVLEAESDHLRNPEDDHLLLVFDPAIRGNTDRVVLRFRKPAAA